MKRDVRRPNLAARTLCETGPNYLWSPTSTICPFYSSSLVIAFIVSNSFN